MITASKLRLVGETDPVAPTEYLPFDPARHTLSVFREAIKPQLIDRGYSSSKAHGLAHRAALEIYANGWRTSQGIAHKADRPVIAPRRPPLPPADIAA